MNPPAQHSATPLPPPTDMEQAALDWIARCDRGLTPAQEAEFEAWLAAEPRHAELFNEFDGTLSLLERACVPMAVAEPAATVPARSLRLPARWLRASVVAAAAAILVAGYFGWWRPAHYEGGFATEIGGLRAKRLPDGTRVTLNTDSAVSATFSPTERRVRLERGEAHFAVARQPDRPFIVEAGGVAVRAVGTAFNVRLGRSSVEVLVTEGKVQVGAGQAGAGLLVPAIDPRLVITGEKVVLTLPENPATATPLAAVAEVTPVSEAQIDRALSWQERRLDFEAATLAEMAAEFNRHNRHQLVIADDQLAHERFGGSFRPDDYAGFVRMLETNFGVQAEDVGAATLLRRAQQP